jgi:aspartate carbamoyltransferase catalytic subunit
VGPVAADRQCGAARSQEGVNMQWSDSLRGRQIRHIGELTREEIVAILDLAQWFRDHRDDQSCLRLCEGRTQALLFVYESTRTRMGFETAMHELGGGNIYMPAFTAMVNKGETWAAQQAGGREAARRGAGHR